MFKKRRDCFAMISVLKSNYGLARTLPHFSIVNEWVSLGQKHPSESLDRSLGIPRESFKATPPTFHMFPGSIRPKLRVILQASSSSTATPSSWARPGGHMSKSPSAQSSVITLTATQCHPLCWPARPSLPPSQGPSVVRMNQGGVIHRGAPWMCLRPSQALGIQWGTSRPVLWHLVIPGAKQENRQRKWISGWKGSGRRPHRGKRRSRSAGLVTDSPENDPDL